MLRSSSLPDPERRLVRAAFLTLFGILAAQTLLETARDTLFVARLSVARLPWLYLAMAALTLIAARASAENRRSGTSTALLVGSVVTAALWPVLGASAGIYALFLWTGIFSAWTVTQVWSVLAESLDLSQAKPLYGRLAAGGGLGAVAGAVLARLSSGVLEPHALVLLAALVTAVTALGPARALRAVSNASTSPRAEEATPAQAPPLLARLFAMTALVALVSTLIDFTFKEAVASRLTPAQLPAFFATFHLIGTGVSLAVQLFVVGPVLRVLGVGRAQLVLPLTLMAGVFAAIASGGLAAFVLLRGLDTGLRNSFQRPSFELLQVPLHEELRRKAKAMIDVIGQRGGQTVGAVALLVTLQLSVSPQVRLLLLAALVVVWIAVAAGLNDAYVVVLRSALAGTGGPRPDLNLSASGLLTTQQQRELSTVLALLAGERKPGVGADAVRALVPLLARREMRAVARASLIAAGTSALPVLEETLLDPAQPRAVRVNVIRPLIKIDPVAGARTLQAALLRERDPFVGLQLARALGRILRDRPGLPVDRVDLTGLDRAAAAAGSSAQRYLVWRLALDEGVQQQPGRDTTSSAMLRVALREQEETAIELLFEVLALRHPEQNLSQLLHAWRAGQRRTQAAARELVANLLTGAARTTTLALMEPTDLARLAALGQTQEPTDYAPLIEAISVEPGNLGRLAARHAAELRSASLPPSSAGQFVAA